MTKIRVADLVAKYISDNLQLSEVFLLTGAGIMHLTDGLALNKKIKPVCVHHEQTASMSVESYARANQRFGVAFFSTGPAATNAITGLGGAWQDSVPCLFISGQVKKSESTYFEGIPKVRQFGVQELNVLPVVSSISKYCAQVSNPQNILFELDKAVHIARSGRPGPVWLEIPMDVQGAMVEEGSLPRFKPDALEVLPKPEDVDWVVNAIKTARRPVLVAGRGVRLSGAQQALVQFAEMANIPVVTTYLGIDNLPASHPNNIGVTGVKGDRAANLAMQNSDLLIAIGTSLHVSVIGYNYKEFAREAKKVVIDIDLSAHQKPTIDFDIEIESDATLLIQSLTEKLKGFIFSANLPWLQRCQSWRKNYPVCLSEYGDDSNGINIYKVIECLNQVLGKEDIVVSDAGSAFYATSQAIKLSSIGQRYITSGGMATMGYTLPAVIGTSLASPVSKSWGITGDGSFQFCIQELQTLREHGLNVTLIILNNDGYLSIRASQENYYEGRLIGSGPSSGVTMPDTLEIASVYRIPATRVRNVVDLEYALKEASESFGPKIIEVICPPGQLIVPAVSSKVNEDGTMSSRPLEDMAPFLSREEYEGNMIVKAV